MQEIWKDIYFEEDGVIWDYRGLYAVSNMGNIKSLNYNRTRKEKILKPKKTTKGYLQIDLSKNGKRKKFRVHRLVAFMFIDGYFDGAEIDHINTITFDNRVENLRWVTSKQNMNNSLTKQKLSKANSIKIAQYDKKGNLIKIWNGSYEIQRELNIHQNSIITCCKFWQMNCNKEKWHETYKGNPNKSAGGYIWKYAEEKED